MSSFWPRINTVLLLMTLMAVIGLFATRALGGPLDPPTAPAPTDGVRGPGTPISSLPFPITEGGYYYVTRNLNGTPGQSGITISASNVTVDLGGFTLFGGTTPGDGITASGPRYIVIRNGAVRGWTNGINLAATYSRVEDVHASNNANNGVVIGVGSEVRDCHATLNRINGIVLNQATVRNCTVAENSADDPTQGAGILVNGNNSLITGSRVDVNVNIGIRVFGNRNMIVGNQLSGNSVEDIEIAGGSTQNVLLDNVYCVSSNSGTFTTFVNNWC